MAGKVKIGRDDVDLPGGKEADNADKSQFLRIGCTTWWGMDHRRPPHMWGRADRDRVQLRCRAYRQTTDCFGNYYPAARRVRVRGRVVRRAWRR